VKKGVGSGRKEKSEANPLVQRAEGHPNDVPGKYQERCDGAK